MSTPGNGGDRISVSRDTLRAELAEMELRLIEKLASRAELVKLEEKVGLLEDLPGRVKRLEGLTTDPDAIAAMIATAIEADQVRVRGGRERVIQLMVAFGSLIATAFSIITYFVTRGGHG